MVDLSTAGIQVAYGTGKNKPSSFTSIPGPKSIPDLNPEPSTLETTSLNATEWKTYMQGLKDIGGALGVVFGMNQELLTLINETLAKEEDLWIEFYHPKLTDGFFFKAQCAELGFPSADVDAVWDATVNFTPTSDIGWATAIAPTDSVAWSNQPKMASEDIDTYSLDDDNE